MSTPYQTVHDSPAKLRAYDLVSIRCVARLRELRHTGYRNEWPISFPELGEHRPCIIHTIASASCDECIEITPHFISAEHAEAWLGLCSQLDALDGILAGET